MALSTETLADLLRTVHDASLDLASRFKAALEAIEIMDEPITVQIVNYANATEPHWPPMDNAGVRH